MRSAGFGLVAAFWVAVAFVHASPDAGAEPPVFHPLEGRAGRCLACHGDGALGAPGTPSDHRVYTDDVCLSCHARPGGSFAQLYGAFLPFAAALVFGLYRTCARFGARNLLEHLFGSGRSHRR